MIGMIGDDKEKMNRFAVHCTVVDTFPGNAEAHDGLIYGVGPAVRNGNAVAKSGRLDAFAFDHGGGEVVEVEAVDSVEYRRPMYDLADGSLFPGILDFPDYASRVKECPLIKMTHVGPRFTPF